MSTVPPNDRDDRDETAAPDEATHGSHEASSPSVPEEQQPASTTPPPAPAPAPAPAPDSSERTAAPGTEPATRQLPTEDDDDALRQERARRFGRGTEDAAPEPGATTTTAQPAPAPTEPVRSEPSTGTGATGTGPVPVEPAAPEDDPFSDWDDGPQSRAAAHWWGILIAIVFAPVAWYLLTDGGERIAFSLGRNLEAVNVAGLVELAGGILCAIVLLLAARWSSVGSIIVGSIGTLIGGAFLAVPVIVNDFLESQTAIFDRLGQFGTNVYDHLISEGHAGRLLLYGVVLIFLGIVSHGARRQGRREERRKIAAEA